MAEKLMPPAQIGRSTASVSGDPTDGARLAGTSPYADLPSRNFWKTAVAQQSPMQVRELYQKKFPIDPEAQIATAGSCFAQNIARYLRRNGFSVIDTEPAPPGLAAAISRSFGYGLYSARYGNVYTMRQLLHLTKEALDLFEPQDFVWEKAGRFYDALRPSVEPYGLDTPQQVLRHRRSHLAHVAEMLRTVDLFIFTFGLTEAWVHSPSGTVYPTAPGTVAGDYNPAIHTFKNFNYTEILADFLEFRMLVRRQKPAARFLLTVSPVPLTATASTHHVLAATTYSKSVLRAVCGELYESFDDVDYFPAFELIASPFSRGMFYAPNLRDVIDPGVEMVMNLFFAEHGEGAARGDVSSPATETQTLDQPSLLVCEEVLLDAFAR
jgi:hypothetical protein